MGKIKFYIKALNDQGKQAIQKHLDDTENLDAFEKVKGKAVVKHKVVLKEPLTIMMKPRKAVMLAAAITPGIHQFKIDYFNSIKKELTLNGAETGDFQLWVEGKR